MSEIPEYAYVIERGPVPEGTRVKAVKWGPSELVDDNETVPPGTLGTVVGGYSGRPHDQIWVKWDNGSSISLIPPHDEFEIVEDDPYNDYRDMEYRSFLADQEGPTDA